MSLRNLYLDHLAKIIYYKFNFNREQLKVFSDIEKQFKPKINISKQEVKKSTENITNKIAESNDCEKRLSVIVKAGSSNGHTAKRSLSPENNCDVSKKLKADSNLEENSVKISKVLRKIEASSPFNYFLNKARIILVTF